MPCYSLYGEWKTHINIRDARFRPFILIIPYKIFKKKTVFSRDKIMSINSKAEKCSVPRGIDARGTMCVRTHTAMSTRTTERERNTARAAAAANRRKKENRMRV